MITLSLIAGLLSLFLAPASIQSGSPSGPEYASMETKRVILNMIEAHGGMEKWLNAPTIKYDQIFFNPSAGAEDNPWWFDTEVIDQSSRRVVQDWSTDKSVFVFDGEKTWTTNWNKGNPPTFMAQFFYYFLNLPWLTQDDEVILGEPERVSLPGYSESFFAVDMTFTDHPSMVKSGLDTYRLYIHPETWRLQAYEYSVGFAALLDAFDVPDGQLFGPMLRFQDAFQEVDGLLFPTRMHTGPLDGSTIYGYHLITNYAIDQPFDEKRMMIPSDALVDHSRRDR